jgi:hypothetical protein
VEIHLKLGHHTSIEWVEFAEKALA